MKEFKEDLKRLQNFVDEMSGTSSGNKKLEILKKWKDDEFLLKVFRYTYNHFKKYGVHTKVLNKHSDLKNSNHSYDSIFPLLDDLSARRITGHEAVEAVNTFTKDLSDSETKLIRCILDRDLRIGASSRSINKIIPGLIPEFKVALAHPYDPKRVDFINEEWYGSRKLDGVRCICRKEGNNITFYSRSGKEFLTLDKIADEVRKINGDFILDGEVCIVDENGNEDFQGIMKEIRKKNHTIENPKLYIFDFLTLDEFDNKKGDCQFIERIGYIKDNFPISIDDKVLDILPQTLITSEEQFSEMAKDAEGAGFEGIMIRKNIGYEGKRSHNLLKVKKFHDAEYIVLETKSGLIRWTENGKQVERECLSNIIIEHKGNRVGVGSGFSKEQREYYHAHPEELIGKTVTIQYFEESENVNGGYSLRFPVIKHIYKNGRDC